MALPDASRNGLLGVNCSRTVSRAGIGASSLPGRLWSRFVTSLTMLGIEMAIGANETFSLPAARRSWLPSPTSSRRYLLTSTQKASNLSPFEEFIARRS